MNALEPQGLKHYIDYGDCMSINERIKDARRAMKLSQIKFARSIYISNGYLAEIELGNRRVNDRLIQLITTSFEINKQWLVTGAGSMFVHVPDQKLNRITSLFKELTPKFQDYALKQIDQLIELQNQDDTVSTE
jgi:transcriptional regulator with XRE-family HTH domain